jgi:hypothetical protein
MSLFDIKNDYLKALNELSSMEDMPEDAIRDTLEGIEGAFDDKAVNVAAFIKNLEAEATAIDNAVSEMQKRSKRLKSKGVALNQYLLDSMKAIDKKAISSPYFELKIKNNPASLIIDDETMIPAEYIETVVSEKVDKKAIKAHLKDSAESWAHLQKSVRLDIK